MSQEACQLNENNILIGELNPYPFQPPVNLANTTSPSYRKRLQILQIQIATTNEEIFSEIPKSMKKQLPITKKHLHLNG
jgi:hypothetical protein